MHFYGTKGKNLNDNGNDMALNSKLQYCMWGNDNILYFYQKVADVLEIFDNEVNKT